MLSLNKKRKYIKNKIGGSLCFRHISLKKDREKKNMALEKEWLLLTAERFSKEEEQREELSSLINSCLF